MKRNSGKIIFFLTILLFSITVSTAHPTSVHAAYVKQKNTSVSITSKKTGWQLIKDHYFYSSKSRLICGSFTYKSYYYYNTTDGKHFTGWSKRSGNKYYYNHKNSAMFWKR